MKFVGVVLASAVLCLASVTRASEDPKQMFQAATAEFNLGHYAKAASMYEEIYKVTLEPVLLYNIAQAHRLGGDFDKAVFFYKGYLRAQPHAVNKPEVQRRISELELAIEAKRRGQERPPNVPASVEPKARGEVTSSQPTPQPSPSSEPPPATTPPATAEAPPSPSPSPAAATPQPSPADRGHTKKLIGIAVGAFGVAALVTGIALAVVGSNDADKLSHPSPGATFDPSLESGAHGMLPAGVALSIVGVVGVGAGVGLYLWGRHDSRARQLALAGAF